MWRRVTVAVLAGLASLATAAPALGNQIFFVQGTADAAPAACQPITGVPDAFRCNSLRDAVSAANANGTGADGGGDLVYLQAAGDYVVNSALTLADGTTVWGRGPRTTTVRGSGSSRVFHIPSGADVFLYRLGVAGGRAGTGEGGNILNEGTLAMYNARVTDGTGTAGGGIANVGGDLTLLNVLVDNNTSTPLALGGGILNRASAQAATLSITNSTIAFNRAIGEIGNGGGIATTGSAANRTSLTGVTIARNSISSGQGTAGLLVGTPNEVASAAGSLLGQNTGPSGGLSNCGGAGTVVDVGSTPSNVEDGSTCGFDTPSGNLGLSPALVNLGGDTDVLSISPAGPAKNVVLGPCSPGTDQRNAPRTTGNCDAGAFEEGAAAPPIDSNPFFEPGDIQPPPVPTPIPTVPTQEPVPVVNQVVVVREVSGRVRVRRPGSRDFVELDATQGIPTGSTIDTKDGTVELTSVPKVGAPPEKAKFFDGIFRLTQSRGITNVTLSEALAACPKRGRAAAAQRQRKPKSRKLWGDGKGAFRTSGRYSAATVRGTKWLVQDTCAGTLTRVTQGSVSVRDNVRKKTVIVRAGRRYLARPKR